MEQFPRLRSLGLNGGNLVPLLVRLFLTNTNENNAHYSRTEESILSLVLLLFLQSSFSERTMQVIVDTESWSTHTTALLSVSLQACVFHYFHLLLQNEYRHKSPAELCEGCFSSSPFSTVLRVIATMLNEGTPLHDDLVLHYAIYFLPVEVST